MAAAAEFLRRYRVPLLAVLVSTAVHAIVFVGIPERIDAIDGKSEAVYSATLDPATTEVAPASPTHAAPVPTKP